MPEFVGRIAGAEILSRAAGSIGALAFSRHGDPMMANSATLNCSENSANVPDDLSGL